MLGDEWEEHLKKVPEEMQEEETEEVVITIAKEQEPNNSTLVETENNVSPLVHHKVPSDSSDSDQEEIMFDFTATTKINLLQDLQYSYEHRPSISNITFPHKFYPKKMLSASAARELPRELTNMPDPIPESHFNLFEKETLF